MFLRAYSYEAWKLTEVEDEQDARKSVNSLGQKNLFPLLQNCGVRAKFSTA